jgi:hypothetical protein
MVAKARGLHSLGPITQRKLTQGMQSLGLDCKSLIDNQKVYLWTNAA